VISAALSAKGDVWVPLAFHGTTVIMPTCPGAFLAPLDVQIGYATARGLSFTGANPLDHIRRLSTYLGDVLIGDTNFYGTLYRQRITPVHVAGKIGVSICHVNDVIDLVLRMRGTRAWARSRRSPMQSAIANSAPLELQVHAQPNVPGLGRPSGLLDSFGNSCSSADVRNHANASAPPTRP